MSSATFFNQNMMYQGNQSDDVNARTKLQAAIFRSISGAGYRSYFSIVRNDHWCGGARTNGTFGRAYKFEHFRTWTIHLLDMYSMLQFDRACNSKVETLRELMMATSHPPKGPEVAGDAAASGLWWWERTFLPTLVEAFSCGFDEAADLSAAYEPALLPADISPENVFLSSPANIVPKVWRLMRGFVSSAQLQRADVPARQQVFEPSHFIPFMDPYVAPGHGWTRRGQMGLAIPVYQGPNVWYYFHTFAQRIADVGEACGANPSSCTESSSTAAAAATAAKFEREAVGKFVSMLRFFALGGQVCPQCREHFISQVSRNDMEWARNSENGWDPAHHSFSEAKLYPIEWLYQGIDAADLGKNSSGNIDAGTLAQKLSTVRSGDDLVLFLWKLHNAVQSSVRYTKQCRATEEYDTTHGGVYQCDSLKDAQLSASATGGGAAGPRFQRSWPFMDRFRFWVRGGQLVWAAARDNSGVTAAAEAVAALDTAGTRERFWTMSPEARAAVMAVPTGTGTGNESDRNLAGSVRRLVAAIAGLDAAVLRSGVIQHEYRPAAAVASFDFAQWRPAPVVDESEWVFTSEPIQECKSTYGIYRV